MSFLLPKGVFSVTAVSLLCPDPLQYVTPVRGSPLSLPVHTDLVILLYQSSYANYSAASFYTSVIAQN